MAPVLAVERAAPSRQSFDLPWEPTAKGRPRSTRKGIVYTPAKTRHAEAAIRYLLIEKGARPFEREAPLAVSVTFYVRRPASAPRRVVLPAKRPDPDRRDRCALALRRADRAAPSLEAFRPMSPTSSSQCGRRPRELSGYFVSQASLRGRRREVAPRERGVVAGHGVVVGACFSSRSRKSFSARSKCSYASPERALASTAACGASRLLPMPTTMSPARS